MELSNKPLGCNEDVMWPVDQLSIIYHDIPVIYRVPSSSRSNAHKEQVSLSWPTNGLVDGAVVGGFMAGHGTVIRGRCTCTAQNLNASSGEVIVPGPIFPK